MSAHIDFRTLPANVPVLCIPRVYPNISEGRIRKIFDDLDMGTLERIDIVSKTSEKGEKFNRVFVHFRRWNNSDNANTARERLLNGKELKLFMMTHGSGRFQPTEKPNASLRLNSMQVVVKQLWRSIRTRRSLPSQF